MTISLAKIVYSSIGIVVRPSCERDWTSGDYVLAEPGIVWNFRVCKRCYEIPATRGKQFRTVAGLVLALCAQACDAASARAAQKYRADEWVTECESAPNLGAAGCSITVPFWQTQRQTQGSFALVIMLRTGNIGIVGVPFPTRAVLRVDKNPPIECKQERYCVFPSGQAFAVLKQLEVGSLILIDVYTAKGAFNFSLTPKGFQAGVAQIRAWGYQAE